jgi:ribosomal protein S18 acetylase RimI-like enzyme
MTYRLRDYRHSDEQQVNDLAVRAFQQYADDYTDWQGFRRRIAQMASLAESTELIVAEQDKAIVGAVIYIAPRCEKAAFYKPEWSVMRMLVVAPDARRQGIGRALVECCVQRALRDRAEILALHTADIMQAALSMYRRNGFGFYADAAEIHGVKYKVYTKVLDA